MAILNVDVKLVEEISTRINRVANNVQTAIEPLALLVIANEDNPQLTTLAGECKKMQSFYNDHTVPACSSVMDQLGLFEELQEAINRGAGNLSSVKTDATEMNVSAIEIPQL